MSDHRQSRRTNDRYELLAPVERKNDMGEVSKVFRSLGVKSINIDRQTTVNLDDKLWNIETFESDKQAVATFWIDILDEDAPALRITRTLTLPKQDRESGKSDLLSELVVENLSDREYAVITSYTGGLGIRPENYRFDDRYVDFGLIGEGGVVVHRKNESDVQSAKDLRIPVYIDTGSAAPGLLSWAATANTYFTCTIAPINPDGTDGAYYLQSVDAIDVDRNPITRDDVNLRFVTKAAKLTPGESRTYPADIYLGEKNGIAFREIDEYVARNYYRQIELGFGWCTFGFLVELMLWLLNTMYFVTGNFGVAIIILVLIVRALLHPITKSGQINMTRMQKAMGDLQPKFEEIKKKYANDKAKMQEEQMKLYREMGSGPLTGIMGCLPMALQMPIWVALWISLSNNILMRHKPFFSWIDDLTAPDAFYTFSSTIFVPLVGWEIDSFNLLPILLAIFMYTQQKLMPKPTPNPNMSDEQRRQQDAMQKMLPIMNIFMLIIFYKAPSGLTLYIMCSSAFGTIEQLQIRKRIAKMEEDGTLMKPKTAGMAAAKEGATLKAPGWLERLQQMAEQAKKDPGRSGGKGGKR